MNELFALLELLYAAFAEFVLTTPQPVLLAIVGILVVGPFLWAAFKR